MTKAAKYAAIPSILYGTAWKEENTQRLTYQALNLGFRGIDTANQRKHYFEAAVGLGIQQFLQDSHLTREDLFLQTKFTSASGQDHRKPYDDLDSFANQVKQSFESSLQHLQTDYIDSYILHGLALSQGLIDADWESWNAMEHLFHEGKMKFLGISNINLAQLELLCSKVAIKPSFVQNRCFAATQWDQKIRSFCAQQGITYQGFSLLTANQNALFSPLMRVLATKYSKTIPQIIFRFASQIGMLPLTGTTDQQHIRDDLTISDFELGLDDLNKIEQLND